jgi:diketogulonate reductase-like aldo/keto reductase
VSLERWLLRETHFYNRNGDHHRVRAAFEESFKRLNTTIDLYLLHWPQASMGGKSWLASIDAFDFLFQTSILVR